MEQQKVGELDKRGKEREAITVQLLRCVEICFGNWLKMLNIHKETGETQAAAILYFIFQKRSIYFIYILRLLYLFSPF